MGGWPGGNPALAGMVAEHADPHGPGILDQHAEHALARSGTAPDAAALVLGLEPRRQELDGGRARSSSTPERAVAGVGQRPGLVDDVAEQVAEIQIGLEQEGRLERPGGSLTGSSMAS